MSGISDEQLDQELRALTSWRGGGVNLWRRALASAGQPPARQRSVPWWWVGLAAAALVVFAAGVWGVQEYQPRRTPGAASYEAGEGSRRAYADLPVQDLETPVLGLPLASSDSGGRFMTGGGGRVGPPSRGARAPASSVPSGGYAGLPMGDAGLELPLLERQVVQRATIELRTPNVEVAFAKASQLVSPVHGEYIEESSISTQDGRPLATLTLRVASERVAEVLIALRELGEVRSERLAGEDVTAKVVDADARLRNAQRLEAELLELLEKREDAKLEDILRLRDHIAQVREQIERITSYRQQLGRLVALATVLVVLDGVPVEAEPGLSAWAAETFACAWDGGVRFLLGSVATIAAVLVGGAVGWTALIVIVVAVWTYRRRRSRAG